MNYVLTTAQIAEAEREAARRGVSEMFLRMNAALAITEKVAENPRAKSGVIAVFCGSGGNGYDGILAACMLARRGYKAEIYTVGDESKFDRSAIAYAVNEGMAPKAAESYDGGADIIVDAIFGIGLSRAVTGKTAELINKLNAQTAFKIAVDIPSGLNADTGEIMGTVFIADVTLTFSCYKIGMLYNAGRDACGRIAVADVGAKAVSDIYVIDDDLFGSVKRRVSMHKGDAGRVFIIGGCGTMIGAPMLAGAAAHAAYLNGAGTVTVCLPKINRTSAAARATMALMKFLRDTADGFIKFDKGFLDDVIARASAVAIGMGMGETPDLKRITEYLCAYFDGPLVIDADALNAIKGDYGFLKDAKAKIAVTPHVGEFVRLTGKPATVENAMAFSKETGVLTVLKSATTVITDGKQVRINTAGTPAMAKGGTGDVLGGCITALACSFDLFDAASIACYRNGMGAANAVGSYAEMMLTPRDILKFAKYEEL